MIEINIVTIFPDMFKPLIEYGITHQAIKKDCLIIRCWNPRDFVTDLHRTVDDRPYGGGPGMVMKPEPIAACLDRVKCKSEGPIVYLSPQGKQLNQRMIKEMSHLHNLILLAGRYEGIDERILQTRVDLEVSVGDYVLSGGELAAMMIIEAISRLIPGVLRNIQSAEQDSFSGRGLLDYPHYTRPQVFEGLPVPKILLSGNHKKIKAWRLEQALHRTRDVRPDLLERKKCIENNSK